jgi:hypothetical protein
MARREITGRKPYATPDRAKRRSGPPRIDPEASDDDEPELEEDNDAEVSPQVAGPQPIESTVHQEPRPTVGIKTRGARGPPVASAAYSIRTFCQAHHLSEAMYFKMKAAGWGPAEMKVGSRVLISFEAAAAWRREREHKATTA